MDFIQQIVNNKIVVPISSQPELGSSVGSETRVYDPERIMKLHERLSEIKNILYSHDIVRYSTESLRV
jgi:hypothetical protein